MIGKGKGGFSGIFKTLILLMIFLAIIVLGEVKLFLFLINDEKYAEWMKVLVPVFFLIILAGLVREAAIDQRERLKNVWLDGIDKMDNMEFTAWCIVYLELRGFDDVNPTNTANGKYYGVDIVAYRGEDKYAIQCRRFAFPVSNKAVTEVYNGKKMYECNKAAVMTNRSFSEAARQQADSRNVELWDREWLLSNALDIQL